MRNDPQRFVTFVLGSFACIYYLALVWQVVRVRGRIGKSPVAFGAFGDKVRAACVFAWPILVLAWAYSPERFGRLPRFSILEGWGPRLLGLLCLCAGASLGWMAFVELGDSWRIGAASAAPASAARAGIRSSIRHPLRAALRLWLFGMFLMAPNLLFAALWLGGTAAARALQGEDELKASS